MSVFFDILKPIVALFCVLLTFSLPVRAEEGLDDLFTLLAQPDLQNWEVVEEKIWLEWSRSGSASMDLLLQRGNQALDAEEYGTAIEHLTALTDHAPDFAEGWNARARAYYQVGLYGPAMADIYTALSLNPRHFAALTGLAVMLEDLGKPSEALAVFRQVTAIHPHRPDVITAIERLESQVDGQDI